MMLIDCQACPVRGTHCTDCMVTALAAPSVRRETMALDPAERRAVSVLLAAGLFSRETAGAVRAVLEPAGSVRRSGARAAG